MTPELQAVVERLEETEKQVSHLASLVVAQSDTDRTVEARSFIVRGADGQPRAELSARDEETAFCLFHADGKVGVEISIREQGPRLVFCDTNGTRRATLETLAAPGGPWLGLFDANGNVRACLGTSSGGGRWTDGPGAPEEGPWLEFYDARQKSVVNVRAGEHGPRIGLFYGNLNRGIDLALSEGGPEIALFDANGKPSVVVQAPEAGGPGRLFLCDRATNVSWSAPPVSSPDPTQSDSHVKGGSVSMPKSWISRALDRATEWVLLRSLQLFVSLACLAVPFLGLLTFGIAIDHVVALFSGDWGSAMRIGKNDAEILFAGIVISLLLCIGIRTEAFDRLSPKEK